MKAVVLAGGEGTRLRPFTFSGPKQMIKVANKPLLVYNIEQLREAGVTDVAIVSGTWLEYLKKELGDGEKFGVRLTYVYQDKPLGLAHAVNCAKGMLCDDEFILVLGDNLLTEGLKETIDLFCAQRASCLVNLYSVADPKPYGVAVFDGDKLTGFVEKPKEPPSSLVLVGVYVFTRDVWEQIEKLKPSWRGEYEITDAICGLMNSGRDVRWRKLSGDWIDTGKRDDWLKANHLMLARQSGKIVGKNVVLEDSVLIEPVIVGDNVTMRGAVVGPFVSVADGATILRSHVEESIVLDGAELENVKLGSSIIGKKAAVKGNGRLAMTIGDYCSLEVP